MQITFEGDIGGILDAMTEFSAKRAEHLSLPSFEISHEMVDSKTDSNRQYKLTSIGKLTVACTCMAFTHRTHDCKHIRQANGKS